MKNPFIWFLLSCFLMVSAALSQAQTTGGTEKAIVALEEQWLQADKTSNPDLLAPLLADKLVSTDDRGKVTGKAERLAEEKSAKWSNIENSDVKVVVYGDTAVAIGVTKGKGTDAAGKTIEINLSWTDTWVKMPNGKWQCVATHWSPVRI